MGRSRGLCSAAYRLFGYGMGTGGQSTFELSVRIQSHRDHHVIAAGPYAHVRYPGYLFGIVLTFPIALALVRYGPRPRCWLWLCSCSHDPGGRDLAPRTVGYGEFASRTRYKWIPGIW